MPDAPTRPAVQGTCSQHALFSCMRPTCPMHGVCPPPPPSHPHTRPGQPCVTTCVGCGAAHLPTLHSKVAHPHLHSHTCTPTGVSLSCAQASQERTQRLAYAPKRTCSRKDHKLSQRTLRCTYWLSHLRALPITQPPGNLTPHSCTTTAAPPGTCVRAPTTMRRSDQQLRHDCKVQDQ